LVNSAGLRRFALISKHVAKAVGSKQALSAAVRKVGFTGTVVDISGADSSMQQRSFEEET
jgi:hypothetical protein